MLIIVYTMLWMVDIRPIVGLALCGNLYTTYTYYEHIILCACVCMCFDRLIIYYTTLAG